MPQPACESSPECAQATSCESIALSKIPGATKLFLDFLENQPPVSSFYNQASRDANRLRERARMLAARDYRREALVQSLIDQNAAFGSSEKTFEHLELLRRPETVAIVTGQQAALFTGPLYTIMKALAAVRLAESLRDEGIVAVPVFWVSSEDHDFAEANHCKVIARGGELREIRYTASPADGARPVGHIAISHEIEEQIAVLESSLSGEPFTGEVVSLLRSAYAEGDSFARGFSRALARVLHCYGIILLDPLDPKLKDLSKEIYARALEKAGDIANSLVAQSETLLAAGYHAQVHTTADGAPLFLHDEGRRTPLAHRDDTFSARAQPRQSWPAHELAARARQRPEDFSPNVTLRAAVQDSLLPTLVYVGGPSEIAYFAQLRPVYSILDVPDPCVIHRAAATLIDPQTSKTLERYRLRVEDFFSSREEVERKVVERALSSDIAEQFDRLTRVFDEEIDRLKDGLKQFDPTLAEALEGRRPKVHYHFEHLRKSYIRERTQRDEQVRSRISAAISTLYPNRNLQEREVNIFSFIARYGFDVVGTIYRSLDPRTSRHLLIPIGS